MSNLRYEAPDTIDAAVALLAAADGETRILSGGTDVLVQMHSDVIEPSLLVDVKKLAELNGITREAGGFRFGAAVTALQLCDHAEFAKTWPGIIDGAKLIGSTQIKGRATLAGNLCNGSPAADSVPPMIAANATARIVGPNGRRDAPVDDIVIGPGKTSLTKGEIITSFGLPDRPANAADAYQRFTPRTEMDIAVVGVAVNLAVDANGTCTAARMALGAVAERPLLVAEAADALVGRKIDDSALDALAEAARAACRPIDDKRGTKEFRIKVAGVLAQRVARLALQRTRNG